jgi:hypothetical protein
MFAGVEGVDPVARHSSNRIQTKAKSKPKPTGSTPSHSMGAKFRAVQSTPVPPVSANHRQKLKPPLQARIQVPSPNAHLDSKSIFDKFREHAERATERVRKGVHRLTYKGDNNLEKQIMEDQACFKEIFEEISLFEKAWKKALLHLDNIRSLSEAMSENSTI